MGSHYYLWSMCLGVKQDGQCAESQNDQQNKKNLQCLERRAEVIHFPYNTVAVTPTIQSFWTTFILNGWRSRQKVSAADEQEMNK